MDVLNTKIKNIKDEKALKVRPENIKNGVSIFGIQGTYTGSGSSSFDGIYPSPHNSVQDPDARMYNARLQDIEMWDTSHKFLLHTHECWNDNNYFYEDDEGGERGELIDEEHFYGLTAEILYQGEPLTTGTQVDISFNIVDNSNNVLFTCTGMFWDNELSAVYRTVPFSFDSNADGTFSKNAFERGYNIRNFVCTVTVEE